MKSRHVLPMSQGTTYQIPGSIGTFGIPRGMPHNLCTPATAPLCLIRHTLNQENRVNPKVIPVTT
jgi:hypothetical protein